MVEPRRELSDLPFAGALVPHDGDLAIDGHYDGCHFTGGTVFTSARADNGHFMECAFTEVALEDVNARGSRFSDVWLRDVRLLSVELAATTWLDATFIGCAAAGVQAFDASLRRVQFIDCKLDSVNFRGAQLADITFENCLLRDVDFGGAKLQQVRFPGSTLARADFSRATLDKVDLRGAQLDITAGFESLRGAIMSTAQLMSLAPVLAQQLGIQISDT